MKDCSIRKYPDPYRAFRFKVEIGQIQQGGFQSISGLERTCTIEPYREGGLNHYEHQLITLTNYPPLVLKRGLFSTDLWDWHQEVINGKVQRRNIAIMLCDSMGRTESWHWVFENAFPSKWTGAELDATSNNIATESIEFVHHGLTRQR